MSTLPQAKVAVITRTKNRPVLLRRALDSVRAQTFEDYVHIVVNDAGEPRAVEEEVARLDPTSRARVHVVHRDRSIGMEAASNDGIARSSSTYLVIHDDDDTWAPTFLSRTVERLEDAPHPAGMAVRTEVVYERVDGDSITTESREILASDKHDVTLFEILRRNYVPPISLIYRRAMHDEIGAYDESLPVLGDWEFILRLLRVADIGFIDGPPLAFWHHRKGSAGALGNSVIAGATDHRKFDQVVRDRYLRSELRKRDNLGSLLYLTELIDRGDQLGLIRHEQNLNLLHNINNQAAKIGADLDSRLFESGQVIRELTGQLAELNRNLVGQSNRFVAQLEAMTQRVSDLEELVFTQTPRERVRSWKSLARRKAGSLLARLR